MGRAKTDTMTPYPKPSMAEPIPVNPIPDTQHLGKKIPCFSEPNNQVPQTSKRHADLEILNTTG